MRGFALLGALCLVVACEARDPRPEEAPGSLRIVSINPSLTAILLALGARDSLVGIDEVSAAQQPELAGLPRVGGLFSP
ncbi:MAG: ABC transporter substrate-binding protein, partial [Myxococcota bacterium]